MTALPPEVADDPQRENAGLRAELRAARDRQAASAEILRAIANASGDAEQALQQITEITARLFGAPSATLTIADGDKWGRTIRIGPASKRIGAEVSEAQRQIGTRSLPGTVLRDNRQVYIPDLDNVDPSIADWPGLPPARAAGTRVMSGTPLRREGKAIGVLIVYRDRLLPFSDEELALQQSFADQAVIAIENARLFNETREALERQTATADILKVIASSPSNVQPVFEAIAQRSNQLLNGLSTAVYSLVDNVLHLMAFTPISPEADEALKALFPQPLSMFPFAEGLRRGEISGISDSEVEFANQPARLQMARLRGWRSNVWVPLLRDRKPIGAISVTRVETGSFAHHHVQLLKTFADQAVIAIENARLFNETKEALERQTATADILEVIASSPSDVQPVFQAIVHSAANLFAPCAATITTLKDAHLQWNATAATIPDFSIESARSVYPIPFDPDRAPSARAMLERRIIQFPDTTAPDIPEFTRRAAAAGGFRSVAFVPLINQDRGIGTIILTHPQAGFKLSEKQLALVKTFADQAVIAIENARLFEEVQAKTRDLTEALTYQTGSGNILKVIASSPTDVEPVLRAIVESACELCESYDAIFRLREGDILRFSAHHGHLVTDREDWPVNRHWTAGRAVIDCAPIHVHDMLSAEGDGFPEAKNRARKLGQRTVLSVPLLREGESIGVITLRRLEVNPFTDKQIALLQTFADQAVIAIGNVRLFEEVQARTRELSESLQQQTATSEVLTVISNSYGELPRVFDAMLDKAMRLCGAEFGVLNTYDGKSFHTEATRGLSPEYASFRRSHPAVYGPDTAPVRLLEGEPHVQILDLMDSDAYRSGEPHRRALVDLGGARSLLAVPLVKSSEVIGNVMIFRKESRPFTDRQIALLEHFAAQAVIGIENTRLLNELRNRTADLSESLQQQTATADVLKVISRSAFDLQTVLETLIRSAVELSGALRGVIFLRDGDLFRFGAASYADIDPAWLKWLEDNPHRAGRHSLVGRAISSGQTVCIPDFLADPEMQTPGNALGGIRAGLAVPLLRDGRVEGVMALSRPTPGPFTQRQIELVQTFADQAVIAIENARLFEEVQAKTRDLTEALTYQTGSGNILKVIASSPTDVEPVLTAIVETACELCEAYDAVVLMKDGHDLRFSAHHGPIPMNVQKWPINRRWTAGRAFLDQKPVHVHDLLAEGAEFPDGRELSQRMGHRTILSVPLLRENESIGSIVLRRTEVNPFSDKQIALLQTFADQAVIAIGNVRLFEEVQERTRELSESLEFQTATSEVLKVISRSPDKLQPVLDIIVDTSRELCGSDGATIFLLRDGKYHLTAVSGPVPAHLQSLQANPQPADDPRSVLAYAAREKKTLHFPNVADDPEFGMGFAGLGGPRALVVTPLIREGEAVGIIVLRQSHLKPFTPRQIQAIEVFADQAVIAISNVGLFEQVQQRTRELSQSLDDLRAAQDRLIQTEKLASLGQLTAGIAHEIKNPLNFVNNFASVSAELTDELNDALKGATLAHKTRTEVDELTGLLKDNLEKVVQHGKRADSIVKNMLLHSREGSGDHRPADVNALVDESLNLAYHGARAEKPQFNVTLQRNFDPDAGMIEVFPQEITRVFLNLISNGFYAVTKRKAERGAGFEPVVSASTKSLGDKVEIRIRDNGTGIAPEVREKMFNPFFTTKPAGEGTGLGLSMSHDIIVKQHGGTIDVASEAGQFTEFAVVLPRTSNLANKSRGQT